MKILFAGIIARYPFGGVTWCSLMYLLGLRALGHEVFYIEDTGECVYDPVQNTRATDPALRHDLHPQRARAVRPRRPLGVRQLRRQLPRPERRRRAALLRRRRPVHQPLGRLLVLARRVRAHSAQGRSSTRIRRSRSSPSPRPSRGTSSSSSASITCSRSARTSARRRRRSRPATSRGTRPGSRSRSTTGAPTRAPRDRFTTRDDLADRELHRRRRQQGSGVRQVHRPAVADAAALRARDQRPAGAAARARLGHGRRDGRLAHAVGLPRVHPAARRPSSASPSTPTSRRDRAGSAIAPSATSRRAARRSCRTPAGRRTCRPARGCSRSRHLDEALAGIDRINGDYDRHARRAARSRASTSTRASCCRALLDEARA